MPDKRVPDRERVVGARAGKTKAQQERRLDPRQAFLEIGGLLLGDPVKPRRRDRGPRKAPDGVEIADHRFGNDPRAHRHIGATIGRYHHRRELQGRCEGSAPDTARAKERDWRRRLDNRG